MCEYSWSQQRRCSRPVAEGSLLGLCELHEQLAEKIKPSSTRIPKLKSYRGESKFDGENFIHVVDRLEGQLRYISREDYLQARQDIATMTPEEVTAAKQILYKAEFPQRFARSSGRTAVRGWISYRQGMIHTLLYHRYVVI